MPLLEVSNINAGYGKIQVLWGITLEVNEGEKVTVIGPNGAGKTTLLSTIVGLIKPFSGEVKILGKDITRLPTHRIVKDFRVSLVPEGGRLFPVLTVIENLLMGACLPEANVVKEKTLAKVFQIFPELQVRQKQEAGSLSGGEQRMLAVARAFMSKPKILLLDEISWGLGPIPIQKIYNGLGEINKEGTTILFVEQYAKRALEFADRAYVLERGKIPLQGSSEEMLQNPYIKEYYL